MNPFLDSFLFVWRLIFPSNDARVLDHVNVPKPSTDWRDEAVKAAAAKYGRPFRCAAGHVAREVLLHDESRRQVVIVDPNAKPKVTALKAAKR